jgi:hypothetical protein
MDDITKMSTAEKITTLNYIKKNYNAFERVWTKEKIEWLENIIKAELFELSDFKL